MKNTNQETIDIFTHISPPKYNEKLFQKAKYTVHKEINAGHPALVDLDARFRIMDSFKGLRQVLSVVQPPLEMVVSSNEAVELARLANDEMAELVSKYPERFAGAAACLPMNNVDAALKEADRAIKDLNFKGIQVYTPVDGKPLDLPEFMALYAMMSGYDLPIWIHPTGEPTPDYVDEDASKYEMFMSIGWPYETTKGMARLVFSGVFDKYPDVKFVVHHCGAMVPFFASRLCLSGRDWLQKSPEEYFKMFYVDTALQGYVPSLLCGYTFYGADHVLFGTDSPFGGEEVLAKNFTGINSMGLPETAKNKIFSENAKKLLHLS